MNAVRFDVDMKEALQDLVSQTFSANYRKVALANSLRVYSKYFPDRREIGEGRMQETSTATDTTLKVVGGPFVVGDSVVIGAGLSTAETRTIITVAEDSSDAVGTLGYVYTITVPAITYDHMAGELVNQATLGLDLVANQELYALPRDLMGIDQESLDLALGVRAEVKRTSYYYDALYSITNQRSSMRLGAASNVGFGGMFGYPMVGNPFDNPNQGIFRNSPVTWSFRFSDRPDLRIIPAPTAARTYRWMYQAQHIAATVPDYHAAWLLHYAIADACTSLASALLEEGVWSEADVTEDPARATRSLLDLAETHRKLWDNEIKFRPIVAGG